jgi:hypothetical protein
MSKARVLGAFASSLETTRTGFAGESAWGYGKLLEKVFHRHDAPVCQKQFRAQPMAWSALNKPRV